MPATPLADCIEAFASGLEPPPSLSVSAWADAHRMLPPTSAEPGPWLTSRAPYLREIMDRLSPGDPCETVVIMKGAQLGLTSVAENWMGHAIHIDPGPALLVQPTWNTARDYARDRINPLIRETPILHTIVGDQHSRKGGTTTTRKTFPGGFLVITGANSAAELRAKAIRRLVLDEVDGYPLDVDGEGDPVALALKRTATFANRKVLIFSTPTIQGSSRIEAEFCGTPEQRQTGYSPTDQRHYFVPCPHCEVMQTLEWEHVKWTTIGRRPEDAAYVCPHCGAVIEAHEKEGMLARGEWRPTAESRHPKVTGYFISGLYRPHGWRSWGDIALDWEKASRTKDTALQRVLVNTDLAETWEVTDGQAVDGHTLMARLESYGSSCPRDVLVVTAGVDVQADRLEVELVGWGVDEESWSLDYKVLRGDPEKGELWELLDALLLARIPHPDQPGGLAVAAACVDAGFMTQRVCEWTRARRTRRVWAIKGVVNSLQSPHAIWNVHPKKPGKGKFDLYAVGTDTAKELLYARLLLEAPGPGYCHFTSPHNDETYFLQLTAERLRTRYHHGRASFYWWKPDHRRNEALDCRVYATAALKSLLAMGLVLTPRPPEPRRPPPPQPRPDPERGPVDAVERWLRASEAFVRGGRRPTRNMP
jgi:phage terminase large subunit GpA-like protein